MRMGFSGNTAIDIHAGLAISGPLAHSWLSAAARASTWLQVVTHATHSTTALEAAKPEDITKALGSGTDCVHTQISGFTVVWGSTQTTYVLQGRQGPWWSSEREPDQKVSLSGFRPLLLPRARGIPQPGCRLGDGRLSLCLHRLQAVVHHPARAMTACRPLPSLSPVPASRPLLLPSP